MGILPLPKIAKNVSPISSQHIDRKISLNLGKPGFRCRRKFWQQMLCSNVQGIIWEGGDHAGETGLPEK